MRHFITSSKDVIEKLGGDDAVATMFEVSKKAVSNWRVWNRFPAHTLLKFRQALHAAECEADLGLWAFDRAPRSPNKQPEQAQ